MHVLLQPTSSPLLAALLTELRNRYPAVSVHFDSAGWAPAHWEATRDVLGDPFDLRHDLSRADLVLALDADFLSAATPEGNAPARQFASRRSPKSPSQTMARLYVAESALSVTGASADQRIPLPAGDVGRLAAALFSVVAKGEVAPHVAALAQRFRGRSSHPELVEALARDLRAHRGRCAVLVGERQPPEVHAIGIALNAVLGNFGKTVEAIPSVLLEAGTRAWDPERLDDALEHDAVDTLLMLGGNPVYTRPQSQRFRTRLARARERVYLGAYENETAREATWFVPELHFLECWGDGRSLGGTLTLQQPLVRPLVDGKSAPELLAAMTREQAPSARLILAQHYAAELDSLLRFGMKRDSASSRVDREPRWDGVARALDRIPPQPRTTLELDVLPDPRVGLGLDSNVPWLLELPEPISKLVWDNALLLSPSLAGELGVETGDVVKLSRGDETIRIPAFVQPGQAPRAAAVWLGWGRSGAERNCRGVGVDVSPVRPAADPWVVTGVRLEKTEARHELVTTQRHADQHGRPIALRRSLSEWQAEPDFANRYDEDPPSILPNRLSGSPQWGMTIDLGKCTGCSTCVIACQAENNVPVVGKPQVALGREMHWLRIDRYYEGDSDNPKVDSEPMACQHCEKAPCEYVCPVNATVHSPDGLNEMVYNRCVGTRFCSNNCPYKVRRFNFYNYNQDPPPELTLSKNPDVTVRGRGVMEKCTYCVQRIRRAQIDARIAGKKLEDGDVVTACQQACPVAAIEFGDIADPASRVSEARRNPRLYAVLNEVGTVPRTRYLARIDNPKVGK